MDPNVIAQLNSQLRDMSELLSKQSSALSAQMQAMNAATNAAKNQTAATSELSKAEKQAGQSAEATTKQADSYARASATADQATKSFSNAVSSGKAAIIGFAGAMLDNTPGMAKYGDSVKTATDGLGGIASNFGLLGKATGALLGVFGELIGASLKYTDNVVKAYDDVAAAGARISSSPESIMKLGRNAGLSSSTIGILTKGVETLGSNLRGLGLSASQGVDTFGKMIAYGDKTLAGYRKLGLTQEDVTNMTAKYAEMQVTSGANMRKPINQLQRESKDYMDGLLKLAELTGINTKRQQEAQEQALANENFNAFINKLNADIAATSNPEEKKRLEAMRKAKMELATYAQAQYGAAKSAAILQAISTEHGTIMNAQVAKLQQSGINITAINEETNKGNSQLTRLQAENVQAVDTFNKRFGDMASAAGDASIEYQRAYMIDNGSREAAARDSLLKSKEGQAAQQQRKSQLDIELEAVKNREKGIMAERAKLEIEERAIKQAMDPILKQISDIVTPLLIEIMPRVTNGIKFVSEHFDKITAITKTLAITFGVLSGVAVAGKVVGTIKNASSFLKGIFGGNKPIGSAGNEAHITLSGGRAGSILGELKGEAAEAGAGAGKQGGVIGGLVESLKYASAHAKDIIKGGAALGGAFLAIGGGAAAAIWIVGKALPIFSDGMKSFNKVDGKNLALVGAGLLGISAGSYAFVGGAVLSTVTALAGKLGVKGPLERVADQLIAFQKLPIDTAKVKANGEAAWAFSKAIVSTLIVGKLAGVVESINLFFDKKPPFKDFQDFSNLDINEKKVKINSIAFTEFANAMSAYKGSTAINAISTALAEGVASHLKVPLPLDKFKTFSDLVINPKQTKQNALAFRYFSEAMSGYKGTNSGVLTALNQLIGSQITKLFDPDGAVKAFQNFTNTPFGPNADKNAAAFFKFATAMGMLTGSNSSGGSSVLNTLVDAGVDAAKFVGGAITSTVSSIGGLLGKIIKAESGGSSTAAAKTSSAYGLGQFTKGTFEGIAKQKGSPVFGVSWDEYKRNPDVQMKALQFLVQQNQAFLSKSGIPVDDASTYLAHFLGPGGARNIYRQPDSAPLSQVVTSAAYNANRSVFDKAKTVGGLKIWAGNKMGGPPLKAAKGGVFTGPKTGYPMELHGTEIVVPLNQNSVLTKLANLQHDEKEAASLYSSLLGEKSSSAKQNATARLIEIDGEMKEMMLVKLKRVLTVLDSKYSTSNKILKHMSI